jgi:hypothetical protein
MPEMDWDGCFSSMGEGPVPGWILPIDFISNHRSQRALSPKNRSLKWYLICCDRRPWFPISGFQFDCQSARTTKFTANNPITNNSVISSVIQVTGQEFVATVVCSMNCT